MASTLHLWWNPATFLVSNLAAAYSTFCFWDAVDYSHPFQYSYNIGYYVPLSKRLDFLLA